MPNFGAPPIVACAQQNRNEIRLDGFDLSSSTIVADLGTLFAGTDLSKDNQCHSGGDSCPPMFTGMGLTFLDGARLSTQTLYHLE